MKTHLFFLLLLPLVIFSCSDSDDPIPVEEDPTITLKEAKADFTNKGGVKTISFVTNKSWTAKSDASWCTLSPSSGDESAKSITVTVATNDTYDDRNCTVTISAGGLTKNITVTQGESLGLLVSDDDKTHKLTNKATTIEVEVKANVEFHVEVSDDWITDITTRGLPSTMLQFDIAENELHDSREGTITIKQKKGDLESVITVYQSQQDAIILSKKRHDLSSDEQALEVVLQTNVEFEVIIPEDAKNWVSYTETRALRDEVLLLDVAENNDYTARSTEVYVKNRATNLQDTLIINQSQVDAIILSEKRHDLSSKSHTLEVELQTNVEFEVIIPHMAQSWVSCIETRALRTETLTLSIAENKKYDARTTEVYVKNITTNLQDTLTINQSQMDAIILSEKRHDLSSDEQALEVVLQANVEFEVIIPHDAKDWVSYSETRALTTKTAVLNISENESADERVAEVFIKDKATALQDTVIIKQHGKGIYFVKQMGTLGEMLNQTQKDTITTMIVRGEINKADFDVMKSHIPNLRYIDLKDVKCEGDKIPYRAFGDNNYYNSNRDIETIILPQTITTIESRAFSDCRGLIGNLIIPDGVTEIGQYAFYNCHGFTGSLILSDELTTIGEWAFSGCSGFTGDLNIPNGVTEIRERAFSGCSAFNGNLTLSNGLTKIGEWAFRSCSGFTGSLILSDGLKSIGQYAFHECSGFTGDLIIPNGVTTIGQYAFSGCSGFTGSLILSDELIEIGELAFNTCTGFTGDLVIPNGVTEIGEWAFNGCTGFTGNLTLSDELIEIGKAAFNACYGFTGDLVIPNGVTTIPRDAFRSCRNFNGNLILSDGLIEIGLEAFMGCSGFTGNLIIPDGVTTIGELAFRSCSGFTGSLSLSDGLTEIETKAFEGCTGFTGDLVIPNGVRTIGEYAFNNCSGFTGDLILSDGLTEIENAVFLSCSGFTGDLIIPDGVTKIGQYAFQKCFGLSGGLILPESLTTIEYRAFYNCSGLTGSLIIPDGVAKIGQSAFMECSGLTGNLVLPNGATTIGGYAFYNCSGLTGNLILPAELTTIEENVFYNCPGFTGSLIIPNGVTTIGERAFMYCSGLTGDLALPDATTTIGEYAFYNCSGLTGLTIGENLTTIYKQAFRNCSNIQGSVVFPISLTSLKTYAFSDCDKIASFRFPHIQPIEFTYLMLPHGVTIEVPNEVVSIYKSTGWWQSETIVGY